MSTNMHLTKCPRKAKPKLQERLWCTISSSTWLICAVWRKDGGEGQRRQFQRWHRHICWYSHWQRYEFQYTPPLWRSLYIIKAMATWRTNASLHRCKTAFHRWSQSAMLAIYFHKVATRACISTSRTKWFVDAHMTRYTCGTTLRMTHFWIR